MSLRQVASYSKPDDAYLAASFLEGNGLSPNIRDGHTIGVDWFYSQAIGGVKLEVPEDEYEKAIELLELPSASENVLKCPHCGSDKVKLRQLSGVTALAMLVFGILLPIASHRADCLSCKRSLKVKQSRDGIKLS